VFSIGWHHVYLEGASVASSAATSMQGIVETHCGTSVLSPPRSPTMKSLSCPNTHRPPSKNGGTGAIIRPAFYQTWSESVVASNVNLVERHLLDNRDALSSTLPPSRPHLMKWTLSVEGHQSPSTARASATLLLVIRFEEVVIIFSTDICRSLRWSPLPIPE